MQMLAAVQYRKKCVHQSPSTVLSSLWTPFLPHTSAVFQRCPITLPEHEWEAERE